MINPFGYSMALQVLMGTLPRSYLDLVDADTLHEIAVGLELIPENLFFIGRAYHRDQELGYMADDLEEKMFELIKVAYNVSQHDPALQCLSPDLTKRLGLIEDLGWQAQTLFKVGQIYKKNSDLWWMSTTFGDAMLYNGDKLSKKSHPFPSTKDNFIHNIIIMAQRENIYLAVADLFVALGQAVDIKQHRNEALERVNNCFNAMTLMYSWAPIALNADTANWLVHGPWNSDLLLVERARQDYVRHVLYGTN